MVGWRMYLVSWLRFLFLGFMISIGVVILVFLRVMFLLIKVILKKFILFCFRNFVICFVFELYLDVFIMVSIFVFGFRWLWMVFILWWIVERLILMMVVCVFFFLWEIFCLRCWLCCFLISMVVWEIFF